MSLFIRKLMRQNRDIKPWISKQNKIESNFVILGKHKGFGVWKNFEALYLSDRVIFNKGKTTSVDCNSPKTPATRFNMIKAGEPNDTIILIIAFQNEDKDVLVIREEPVLYVAVDKRKFDPSLTLSDEEMGELKASLEEYYTYNATIPKKHSIKFTDEDKEDFERSLWL